VLIILNDVGVTVAGVGRARSEFLRDGITYQVAFRAPDIEEKTVGCVASRRDKDGARSGPVLSEDGFGKESGTEEEE
jgi:hypothetical protein